MEWKLGGDRLPDNYVFTQEEKRSVCPHDISIAGFAYWLTEKKINAQGQFKSSKIINFGILQKSISYFMDTDEHWNDTHQAGNPTRSKLIKKFALGSQSKRNPWCWKRCSSWQTLHWGWSGTGVLNAFRARGSPTNCLRHSAMITFQINLVACGDDCSKVMKKNLERSSEFPDLLTVRLAWLKNQSYEEEPQE